MGWYLAALKKYADFSGRARRREYWFFILSYLLILIGMSALAVAGGHRISGLIDIVAVLFILAMFIPSWSVTVRRLHDTDRSGWWALISFVPLLGLILLVFMVLDSQAGENRFGPNPKEATD